MWSTSIFKFERKVHIWDTLPFINHKISIHPAKNFLIFLACWTCFMVTHCILVQLFAPNFFLRYGIFWQCEVLTFWFLGIFSAILSLNYRFDVFLKANCLLIAIKFSTLYDYSIIYICFSVGQFPLNTFIPYCTVIW